MSEPNLNEIRTVLRTARARVGVAWKQHSYGDVDSDDQPVCMAGGVVYACERHCPEGATAHLYGDARSYLADFIPGRGTFQFNDTPGRTKQEVLAVFDAAIKHLDDTIGDQKSEEIVSPREEVLV